MKTQIASRVALSFVFAMTLFAGACTRVGVSGGSPGAPAAGPSVAPDVPSGEPVVQSFTGFATLTGRRVPVALDLRTDARGAVQAALAIPELDLRAEGSGAWDDDHLSLRLGYGDGCAGTVRIEVDGEGAAHLVGSLEAGDCTGGAKGPLELRLSPPPGPGYTAPR